MLCWRAQATVVNRDMVAVVTRGTMADAEMTAAHPEATFLLALCEREVPASAASPTDAPEASPTDAPEASHTDVPEASGSGRYTGDVLITLGACAVDVATGQILFGQW